LPTLTARNVARTRSDHQACALALANMSSVGRRYPTPNSTAARLLACPLPKRQCHHLQGIHLDALRIVAAAKGLPTLTVRRSRCRLSHGAQRDGANCLVFAPRADLSTEDQPCPADLANPDLTGTQKAPVTGRYPGQRKLP
jgi:hypothetical protein